MTNYYYESESIGQDDGTTFWWHQLPNQIGSLMHQYGLCRCVYDDQGNEWTGDEFWDKAGALKWAI